MNISPVNTRLIKATNPTFCASLKRKPGLSNYLDSLSFEDRRKAEETLYLFAKDLDKKPEKTVLEVDTISPEKAQSVLVGTKHENYLYGRQYNPVTRAVDDVYSGGPGEEPESVTEMENIELSVGGRSLGFYVNLKKTPEQIAQWLEITYDYLNKGLV